jgi:hypothetical protein
MIFLVDPDFFRAHMRPERCLMADYGSDRRGDDDGAGVGIDIIVCWAVCCSQIRTDCLAVLFAIVYRNTEDLAYNTIIRTARGRAIDRCSRIHSRNDYFHIKLLFSKFRN